MKKIVIGISCILFLLCGSTVFAQMGDMMGMSNQMSEMMGKMSGMMKDMPKDNMKMMSGVMKDMSHQMMEMSTAMGKGKVSAKEMKKMHDRMMEIRKKMSGMEMHK